MSHSTSTANYSLPQFSGSDKPAWLGDINPAMSAIDTQMKANADASTTAGTNATSALNGIGTLANLTTTEKSNLVGAVNEIDTELGTVAGVASGASTTAGQAKTKADGLETYFTMTTFNTLTATANNATIAWSTVREAVNADGSLGKVYGAMVVTPTATSNSYVTFASSFRPSSQITINAVAIKQRNAGDADKTIFPVDVIFNTDGTIRINFEASEYNVPFRFIFIPCLIFATDFGDTGSNN